MEVTYPMFQDFLNVTSSMFSSKDYSKMTLDELVSAEKKVKSLLIPSALFIGFLVGVAVWSATHKGGFFLTSVLLLFALATASWYSKNRKNIQAEISRRDTVG
jgi:thiosulfate reductase cytochrome b subunit